MATRPVFLPDVTGHYLVDERTYDFIWSSGFAEVQKKKNIDALHRAAMENGIGRLLEISSKSSEKVGQRLSAFSLKLQLHDKKFPLESVYQGSKVFDKAGPFTKLFDKTPREAKRFIKEGNYGQLIRFELEGKTYPLSPKNAFYDWLYIRSLKDCAQWIIDNVSYDAFTDIEFNPDRQINCQARAFAEFISLVRRNKLNEAAADFTKFSQMLKPI